MNVDGVKNGIVLDHIVAGKSMEIYRLLKLENMACTVAVLQNVPSRKYGKKDIIKIDEMMDLNLDIIGYIDPNITVNIVRDNELVSKKHLSLPDSLDNTIFCKNPRCITSIEQEIVHSFRLVDPQKRIYRCIYCDTEHK